jgi:hypothetical protein
MKTYLLYTAILLSLWACQPAKDRDSAEAEDVISVVGTFGYDLEFLQNNLDEVIVLKDETGDAQLILAPEYQGRVMTSTARGEEGRSFGWINYDLIASGEVRPQFNPYGGEDRFWLGPEGGQYAIFFEEGDDFVFADWQTPAPLDTEAFEVVSKSERAATFSKTMQLENYSGTRFTLDVERRIQLLDSTDIADELDLSPDMLRVDYVGFSSENRITNTGDMDWTQEDGLLSIWILGMFIHSPATTVLIPYNDDPGLAVPSVNDSYFGKVPDDRLVVEDGFIFFKGDGAYRSKIGVAPERARPVMGSYDPDNQLLTIVRFSLPEGKTDYVNSMWELQNHPYDGDVVNAYNDGPLESENNQLGPFYELESSSPAAELAVGESLSHQHTTAHFMGERAALNELSQQILGIGLDQIEKVFEAQ